MLSTVLAAGGADGLDIGRILLELALILGAAKLIAELAERAANQYQGGITPAFRPVETREAVQVVAAGDTTRALDENPQHRGLRRAEWTVRHVTAP